MASFRLRATPLAADATAPKERLMGPFFLPIDVYKTSQLRDGLFGRFRTDTANAAGYIRVREHLRQLHVAQRLARWLAKKKQLARVLMWIVPREGQDPAALKREFMRDPEVVDYRGIWGFMIALQLKDPAGAPVPLPNDLGGGDGEDEGGEAPPPPPVKDMAAAAFYTMVAANRFACGLQEDDGEEEEEEGGGGGGPRRKKRRRMAPAPRGFGLISPEQMYQEVHRANHEVHRYDDAGARFRFAPTTADWSGTVLEPETVRFMLQTVLGEHAAEMDAAVGELRDDDGQFNCAVAYQMMLRPFWQSFAPRGAHAEFCRVPLSDFGAAALGAGGRLVYEVDDFCDRATFASKRFPKLRPSGRTFTERIEGCSWMKFLEDARPSKGDRSARSVWEVLRKAINDEKKDAPSPPEELAGRRVVTRAADGSWRVDASFSPDAQHVPEAHEWSGVLAEGVEFRVLTVSIVEEGVGGDVVLELEIARDDGLTRFRLVHQGDQQRVETPREWRERCRMRWEVYFDECWVHTALQSSALTVAMKHYDKLEAQSRGKSMFFVNGGWQFSHFNLNPQLNLFASLLDIMENIDIKVNHHNAVRTLIACKSSMKQTDDEFLKPTHLLMVGPRSLGKSFMVKKVLNLLAPGQWDPCSHVSDQAYYGQMPCSDTMTANKTFFYDEGDGPKLGARNRKTLAKAENSKEKKSTEYKERLTTKWSLSTVLGKDRDDQRQVQQFEVSNENVQIHCMNSYFDLAPAMLSRFNLMFFHNIKRLDRELGTVPPSKPTAQQEQLSQTLHRTMQYLDYRQMQLAMLQFAGVIAKPCFEGWNFFKMRFEQVMVKHYGGLVTSDFERRMNDDANMLMWCYMNFYAVFMVFAHASSPFVKETEFRWDMFRECEKHLVPSDALCELVMSMLEECFFSTSQAQVMATIKEHYFPMLKKAVVQEVPAGDFRRWARSGEPPPGGEPVFVKVYLRAAPAPHSEGELRAAVAAKVGLPLSQVAVKALRNAPVLQIEVNAPDTGTRDAVTEWFKKEEAQDVIRDATGIDIVEPGLVILQSAPAADEDGGDESDDEPPADAHAAAADAPPPPKSKVPRTTTKPWRASSTCDGALHGSQKHMLWPVELMNEGATLSDACVKELEYARMYAVVYKARAKDLDGIVAKFSNELTRHMQGLARAHNFSQMDEEHVNGALCDLYELKFAVGNASAARVIELYVSPNELPINGEKTYHVGILKQYLDMMERGELCMSAVFERMRHAYSVPGTRLLSTPFRLGNSRSLIPQLAFAYSVPLHDKTCAARHDKDRWESYCTAVQLECTKRRMLFDAQAVCHDLMAVYGLHCTCFRSKVFNVVRGCNLGPEQMETLMHQYRVPLDGEERRYVPIDRPMEDYAFETHMREVLCDPAARVYGDDARTPLPEFARYHPSLSTAELVAQGSPTLGDQLYPFTAALAYLNTITQVMKSTSNVIDRNPNAPESEAAVRQLRTFDENTLQREQAAELAGIRKRVAAHFDGRAAGADDDGTWAAAVDAVAADARPELRGLIKQMGRPQRRVWLNHGVASMLAVESIANNLRKTCEKSAARLRKGGLGGGAPAGPPAPRRAAAPAAPSSSGAGPSRA